MFISRQQGRSETEEYSSDSESESEDEEELQMILEDLQKQNEELEVGKIFGTHWLIPVVVCYLPESVLSSSLNVKFQVWFSSDLGNIK